MNHRKKNGAQGRKNPSGTNFDSFSWSRSDEAQGCVEHLNDGVVKGAWNSCLCNALCTTETTTLFSKEWYLKWNALECIKKGWCPGADLNRHGLAATST